MQPQSATQQKPNSEILLPPSPVPVPTETRTAAISIIDAEQWLHTHGWRDHINEMSSPRAPDFLRGFHGFRRRLELERRHVRDSTIKTCVWIAAALYLASIGVATFLLWPGGA